MGILGEPSKILTQWRLEALLGAARISAEEGQEERPPEAREKPPVGDRYPGMSPRGHDVSVCPHTETRAAPWPDAASQWAEERLQKGGIQLPWHYGDRFGEEDFRAVGLRAGGIGVVFLVESTRFGEKKLYAAKTLQYFLKEDYLSQAAPVQERIALLFLEEALPWLEMGQHAGIVSVQLLDNIVHPDTQRNIPFVFSRFMEQGSLKDQLGKDGRLGLKEVLGLGLQLCDGLLHAYDYISAHRDLKPDNILVYREGIYQVTDFSAGVIGTRGYMAPEQVIVLWKKNGVELTSEEIPIDQRADQFALVLIMLEALSGKRPFPIALEACTSPERAKEFIAKGVGAVADGLVPGSLRKVLARALSPKPEERFPDLSALQKALLAVYQANFGPYPPPEVEIDDSADWWFNRGWAFYTLGRPASAEWPWKEALEKRKAIPGTELGQARCLIGLGNVYGDTGQFPQAEAYYKDALAMFRTISGTEIWEANCLMNLGISCWDIGQFTQAETYIKDALGIFRSIPGTERDQAGCLVNLGAVYREMGQFPQAEAHLKDALGIFRTIPGTEIGQAKCLMELGNVYGDIRYISHFFQAEVYFKESLRIFRTIPGTEIEQAKCLRNLGTVYIRTEHFSKAEFYIKDGLSMFRSFPSTEIDRAICLMNLGTVYTNTEQFSQAEDHYNEALGLLRSILGTEIWQVRCLRNLGVLYLRVQREHEARQVALEALQLCERYPAGTEQIREACLAILQQLK